MTRIPPRILITVPLSPPTTPTLKTHKRTAKNRLFSPAQCSSALLISEISRPPMVRPEYRISTLNGKRKEIKRVLSLKASARVASIIAAKCRRKYGHRRLHQGVSLSIPTQLLLFRKRKRSSKELQIHLNKKCSRLSNAFASIQERKTMKTENVEKQILALVESFTFMGSEIAVNVGKPAYQIIKRGFTNSSSQESDPEENTGCPSKFLLNCLTSIQDGLSLDEASNIDFEIPLFANAWGFEFWNCYTSGKDVLEIDGGDSTVEQIAWVASTAVDTISVKEKEGVSFDGPFLLYLVSSQDKASKACRVCKPLEAVGICTLNLHSDSDVNHEIQSLKSCEPEFVVSTPERILELLSLKAIDISEVYLLVVDGVEDPPQGSYINAVKSIRQFISRNPQSVVFCNNS